MIAAMGVMLTASLLAAAAIAASSNFTTSAVKDTRGARAQAAAQAGLEAAQYQLLKRGVGQDKCLTNDTTTPTSAMPSWNTATTPHCVTGFSTPMGDGASYKFYVSPAFDVTFTPANATAQSQLATLKTACGAGAGSGERCITAVGTAKGVSRRVTTRVAGKPLFPIIGGLMGFQAVTFVASSSWQGSDVYAASDIGTNNEAGFFVGGSNTNPTPCRGNEAASTGCPAGTKYLCITPGGTWCGGVGATPAQQGFKATLSAPSVDELAWDNSKLVNLALTSPPSGYDATTRYLDVPANTTVQLSNGIYNFCSIRLNNGSKLVAAPGAKVTIYLDSKRRDTVWGVAGASGCPTTQPSSPANLLTMTDGDFIAGKETSTAVNALLDGTSTGRLDVLVYGTKAPTPKGTLPPPSGGSLTTPGDGSHRSTACGDDFDWRNAFNPAVNAQNVYIFAPNSNVQITSNAKIQGAITACTSSWFSAAQGAGFSSPQSSIPPPTGAPQSIPGSFKQCKANNVSDPEGTTCQG
jgi:hypothetical protein